MTEERARLLLLLYLLFLSLSVYMVLVIYRAGHGFDALVLMCSVYGMEWCFKPEREER